MFLGLETTAVALDAPVKEFEFRLTVRVECPTTLWHAAARHFGDRFDASIEDISELIGPPEDPSIADCLMALALPDRIAGCTMTNVVLDPRSTSTHDEVASADPASGSAPVNHLAAETATSP